MRIGVKLETEKQKSLQKSLRNQKSLLDYYSRKPLDKTFFCSLSQVPLCKQKTQKNEKFIRFIQTTLDAYLVRLEI